MGGIEAARKAYVQAATPELIVVETRLGAEDMLAALEALAEVCDAGTQVIVIGHVNDVELYRALMRRHISDYLLAPVSLGELADSVGAALSGQPGAARGHVAAFIGAKGGCGSSTVCHNVAWVLAEHLKTETAIADFDLAFGTLGLDFNQDSARGLGDALAAGAKLDSAMMAKLLARCSDHLGLLTAPAALGADAALTPEAAGGIADLLAGMAAFVALDMPRDWRMWSRALIEAADSVVITAEPDLGGLRNAKTLIDGLRGLRPSAKPPLLVMNKIGMPRRPEIPVRDFAKAADLEPAAVIDFDAQLFGAAANNGLMIGEFAPKARALTAFKGLAETLGGKKAAPEPGVAILKPLIGRLGRRLAR
jgi:pilus assembly protein CpaE